MEKPPMGLHVELVDAGGTHYRWDSGDAIAANRPLGTGFKTRRGDGFADGGNTLPRRIDLDWPDLGLFDGYALIGYDGSVAYEGRLSGNPRSLDAGHSITVNAVGWMSHGRDRKFVEVYVDRETSAWGDMPLNEKVRLATAATDIGSLSWATENGGLVCALPNQALGASVISEAWYVAPHGVEIAKVMYVGSESLPAGYEGPLLFNATDDAGTGEANAGMMLDNTLRTVTPANPRRHSYVRVYSAATAATPAAGATKRFSKIAAYSDHGLELHPIDGEPSGVVASDVMRHIAANHCPKLDTSGIVDTTYPLSHVAFKERTFPHDAWMLLNGAHLWHIGVWENRTLHFNPHDLTDYDWQVEAGIDGVRVNLQGDTTDDLANGIVVEYVNVLTGTKEVLTPEDHSELQDSAVENPANRHGLEVWTEISLSAPCIEADALQRARAALAEFNQPKAPGSITVPAHIKDRAGHWHPVWKVREGDTIAITNHPNDRPRLIVETDYNHGSGNTPPSILIAVDATFRRLDAINDRLEMARRANGLT